MSELATANRPILRASATASIGLLLVALGLLVALHVLRPDLPAAAHMISEYGVGPHARVMAGVFGAFSLAGLAFVVAGTGYMTSPLGRISLAFVVLASVGLAIGGYFPIDPNSNDPNTMNESGRMHGVGFMLGVPSELLGVLFGTLALRRRSGLAKLPLIGLALLVWVSAATLGVSLARQHGFGIPNRTFMLAWAGWLMVGAFAMRRTFISR
ncbi:MAG: DUF998 domain-containing protein [Polyangiaceae bacterium]